MSARAESKFLSKAVFVAINPPKVPSVKLSNWKIKFVASIDNLLSLFSSAKFGRSPSSPVCVDSFRHP